jgi:hypothetical protein
VFNLASLTDLDRSDVEHHGIPFALNLEYYRTSPTTEFGYTKLSPAEMTRRIPSTARTIGDQLKAMMHDGVLFQNLEQKKYYVLPADLERHQARTAVATKPAAPTNTAEPRQELESIDEAERAHAAKLKARFAKQAAS